MDGSNECVLCNLVTSPIGENCIEARKKGINTLREASKRRKDSKYLNFENSDSVLVHPVCRRDYTKEANIIAHLKKIAPRPEKTPTELDLKNKCLFCYDVIDDKFLAAQQKKPKNLRLEVNKVSKDSIRLTLLQKCAERKDKWGNEVKKRIDGVHDLKAAEIMYHRTCYGMFMNLRCKLEKSVGKSGRPYNPDIDETMEKIYSILNNSMDECEFDLADLLKDLEGYIPSLKTIKRKLLEKYGSNVVFLNLPTKKTIFTFRKSNDVKILTDQWYKAKEVDEYEEELRIVRTAATIIRKHAKIAGGSNSSLVPGNLPSEVPNSLMIFLKGLKCSLICRKCEEGSSLDAANFNFLDSDSEETIDDSTPSENTKANLQRENETSQSTADLPQQPIDPAVPSTSSSVESTPSPTRKRLRFQ